MPSHSLEHAAANIPSSRTRASERELSSLAMFPSEERKHKDGQMVPRFAVTEC